MASVNEPSKKCMVCGKTVVLLKSGICEPCQDRIRREAMGEQAGLGERADKELTREGIPSGRKPSK